MEPKQCVTLPKQFHGMLKWNWCYSICAVLADCCSNPKFTCMLVLHMIHLSSNPYFYHKVSVDWTCIIIGYESGYVRFYTENGTLLLEEQLHSESVIGIKCQSQHSPRPDINFELKPEEIYIQYNSCVCILNGANLFPILRNCRQHLKQSMLFVLNKWLLTFNLKTGCRQKKAFKQRIYFSAVISQCMCSARAIWAATNYLCESKAMLPH